MRLIIRNAASTSPRTSPTRVRRDEGSPVASDPIKYHIKFGSSSGGSGGEGMDID
jgi:hypothetical protein